MVDDGLLLVVEGFDEVSDLVRLGQLQTAPAHHVQGVGVRSQPYESVDGAPVSLLSRNVQRSRQVEVRRV